MNEQHTSRQHTGQESKALWFSTNSCP